MTREHASSAVRKKGVVIGQQVNIPAPIKCLKIG